MSVLLYRDGRVILNHAIIPYEFWPYSTHVEDIALSGARADFMHIYDDLLELFKGYRIRTEVDNKTAFGVKDFSGRVWYLGFKDSQFHLGLRVRPDPWITPERAKSSDVP